MAETRKSFLFLFFFPAASSLVGVASPSAPSVSSTCRRASVRSKTYTPSPVTYCGQGYVTNINYVTRAGSPSLKDPETFRNGNVVVLRTNLQSWIIEEYWRRENKIRSHALLEVSYLIENDGGWFQEWSPVDLYLFLLSFQFISVSFKNQQPTTQHCCLIISWTPRLLDA